ncbi:hypothetical protein DSO57_1027664 [Entomophthora muscae]|uniref:Uncharacterized protein n=1 Tax=Entomophthora muscae TaxID=34485 RepID=A0ACC2UNP5_9FUNG|nr:hypothetical protein DSO57_1027664 [Entomophthora muscae]
MGPGEALKPLMSKLESIYTNFWPKALFDEILRSKSIKTIYISTDIEGRYISDFLNLAERKEIVLTNEHGPHISSLQSTGRKWFYFDDKTANIYITQTSTDELGTKAFPTLNHLQEKEDFERLVNSEMVDHCAVLNFYNTETDAELLSGLHKIPSFELIFKQFTGFLEPTKSKFMAKKLSLFVVEDEFSNFFTWTLDTFPYLEHFYIHDTVTYALLPLNPGSLTCLTHFYSKSSQSYDFWDELVRNAPRLLYIYCNITPDSFSELKQKTPNLEILPFVEILGSPRCFNDVSGFNRSLYL